MKPPRWLDYIIESYCDDFYLEDLQGDLHEIYSAIFKEKGKRRADIVYLWLTIRSFRLAVLKKGQLNSNTSMSIIQNLKVAFRVLKRDIFNTVLNSVGLSIGILCFLLLGFYVVQEVSYDHFHTKKDRIYRMWLYEDYGENKVFFNTHTPFRFESLMEENFPEVETAAKFMIRNYNVGREETSINDRVAIISPEFYTIFDFTILDGNPERPFSDKNSLIISESYAKKYFGDTYPVGRSLKIQIGDKVREYTVSALMEDIRKESSIQFDLAISSENLTELFGERSMTAWFMVAAETYVLLKEGQPISKVEKKSQDVIMRYLGEEVDRGEYNLGFQPLTDIHLNPDVPPGNSPVSNPRYVYVLGLIGVLVLIIALVNYSTLSIGKSIKRTREVGMRKILGAGKSVLTFQYLSESILVALFSMIIGAISAIALIPTFNALTGTDIVYHFEYWHLLVFLGIGIVIGVIAGIYPVYVLSGVKVMNAIQNDNLSRGNHALRKGMIIFQFMITVFLISSVLIMQKQIRFLQGKDLGFSYDAVLSIPLFPDTNSGQRLSERFASAAGKGEIIREKLLAFPEIREVAMGSHVFGSPGWTQVGFNDKEGVFRQFRLLGTKSGYIDFFDIEIKEGRGFRENNGLDERQSVILNEAAVEYLGLEDPIGKKLPGDDFGEHRIIGVARDFHFSSLHSEIEPLVIIQNYDPIFKGISDINITDSPVPKLVVKYHGNQLVKAEELLEAAWKEVYPSNALNFDFVDQKIKQQYENEARMKQLIMVATLLSIFIASIGLLGLVVLVANSREKEMGIRKVMGASVRQIFYLFVRSFTIQLIIGIILSIPITVFLMQNWLQDFAYRIDISPWIFVISGAISILIALFVISYHSVKAASVNPVNSLRAE